MKRAIAAAVIVTALLVQASAVAAQTAPPVNTASDLATLLQSKGFGCADASFGAPVHNKIYPGVKGTTATNAGQCTVTDPAHPADPNDPSVGLTKIYVYSKSKQFKQALGAITTQTCLAFEVLGSSSYQSLTGPNWVIATSFTDIGSVATALGGKLKTVKCHVKLPKGL